MWREGLGDGRAAKVGLSIILEPGVGVPVPFESVRYLGQVITLKQQETTEIKNRIRAAWATFHRYRQELTSKNYLLKHRLRLFDAAITPTICYASGTWAPTKEHERMIQSAQR